MYVVVSFIWVSFSLVLIGSYILYERPHFHTNTLPVCLSWSVTSWFSGQYKMLALFMVYTCNSVIIELYYFLLLIVN